MSIVIEVGVNTGTDTSGLLNSYPDSNYYGFEPTLELYGGLLQKYAEVPRVHFLPLAVSIENGFASFNVAGQGDWGCSSLNQFNPDIHSLWYGRPDFKVSHTYKVPTIRLDTFLNEYILNPESYVEIDYLWIDAQGSDMDVLYSLNEYIGCVNAGRLEVAYSVELYSGTKNTLKNAEEFLQLNNFAYTVTPDDGAKECNIEFRRK